MSGRNRTEVFHIWIFLSDLGLLLALFVVVLWFLQAWNWSQSCGSRADASSNGIQACRQNVNGTWWAHWSWQGVLCVTRFINGICGMSGKLLGCFTGCLLFGVYSIDYAVRFMIMPVTCVCLFTTWTQTIRWEFFLVLSLEKYSVAL